MPVDQPDRPNDIKPAAANPIEGSYNPPKLGRGYSFRKDGKQIRVNRKFTKDNEKEKNGNDDVPESKCSKKFPVVTKGVCYVFFWFCPIHGHCWGFHIIKGGEGRKDPSASLYTHLEVAPDIVLMDFACGFEEYGLNREAGYFANTRFYHDIFHGYTHNCPEVYDSRGIVGTRAYNTSICEQFNSFVGVVKNAAKQMSQVRFTFLIQFLIKQWNDKKRKSFLSKVGIAAAGGQ